MRGKQGGKLWVIEAINVQGVDRFRVFDDLWDALETLRWLRRKGFMTFAWRL